jgi:MFS family permease
MSEAADRAPSYSWYALAVLTAVYVLNFLDRTLIYVLFQPIKKDLGLTDLQLAVLGASVFAFFYTTLGIPFGMLADRYSRKTIIGIGLVIWSLFSGLTGFANSFWTIVACRLMVGVGEATLGPAAISLLSDYFPPRMRATAQSIYSSGIALGAGLAFFLGGWIGQAYGWRTAFYALGFPGLLVAILVFALREQPRGITEGKAPAPDARELFRSKPFWLLIIGYALVGLAANNLGVWVGAFVVRVHKLSLLTVGMFGGILSVVVGIPGMILSGYFADRFSRRSRGGRMAFTAAAAALAVPLWIGLLFVNQLAALALINAAVYGLSLMWVGPATADVSDIAGPKLRGLAIGIFFSTINIAAYVIGSPLIGKVSDMLGATADPERMRYALLVCPIACALGALTLWMGSRALARRDQ